MRSVTPQGQLILFPGAEPRRPAAGSGSSRPTRTERKAAQLDRIAEAAERELAECFRSGDAVSAKAAHDRARGARRAAQILRAGPGGVAEVLGGHSTAA
jgi:hypothetical protein